MAKHCVLCNVYCIAHIHVHIYNFRCNEIYLGQEDTILNRSNNDRLLFKTNTIYLCAFFRDNRCFVFPKTVKAFYNTLFNDICNAISLRNVEIDKLKKSSTS